MPAKLIIVSERAELFRHIEMSDREVHLWRDDAPPDRLPPDVRPFEGDPADPATYREIAAGDPDLIAVLDFLEPDDALAAAEAIRESSPEAAFLVLCDEGPPALTETIVARCVLWPDFLRVDLETELHRLETQRRVQRLQRFAEGVRSLPILVQADPDPDAMASALAVRALLRRRSATAPIVSLGEVTRPENRRMAELLNVQVTSIEESELRAFEKVVAVDTQPRQFGDDGPAFAVIDHHPLDTGYRAEFLDVRPHYGATATMLTEYLRVDDERRVHGNLATALLYGIKTDTNSLSRGVVPADVRAYAFLQSRADPALLHRIERPAYPNDIVRSFGRALLDVQVEEDVAVSVMSIPGADEIHVLAGLADFLIDMEGIRWSAAAARVGDELVVKLRHAGEVPGAGEVARLLATERGVGGGHSTMAQAVLRLSPSHSGDFTGSEGARSLLELLRPVLEQVRRKARVQPRGKNRRAVAVGSVAPD